ncbi:MAG TPA: SAM-dependent methyltransferase [Pseudonocardiaceae bacterium]|nr:SAM-dependent methyltransferase [Pseudonocardiaceae bacterium]
MPPDPSETSSAPAAWAPPGVDLNRPNAARVYDVYLGGAHNFAVDREFARQAKELLPDVDVVARMNRRYLQRVVRELSAEGVDQFLDLGSGIPTVGNVHEIAQEINPDARVVYVDNETVAIAHSQLILEDNPNATIVAADIREPEKVLNDPETQRLLDFDRPIAVIMCTILHFIDDDRDPLGIVAAYRDALPRGSYLAISHGTTDNRPDLQAFGDSYRRTANPVTLRSRAAVERFFDGFELIEPGLVFTPEWRPESVADVGAEPERSGVYAGVGRKP